MGRGSILVLITQYKSGLRRRCVCVCVCVCVCFEHDKQLRRK